MKTLTLDPSVVHRGIAADRTDRADGPGSVAAVVVRIVVVLLIASFGVLMLGSVVGPKVLPYKTYFVRSGSMRPTIPVGALAVYRPVDAMQLAPGDVIAFSRPGGAGEIVSHRIVRIEVGEAGRVFVTKGDANSAPDDWRVPAVGRGWRYRWHVPLVGFAVGGLGTVQGRLVILLVVGLSLTALALSSIWRTPTPAVLDVVRPLPVIPREDLPSPVLRSLPRPFLGDDDALAPSVAYRRPVRLLGSRAPDPVAAAAHVARAYDVPRPWPPPPSAAGSWPPSRAVSATPVPPVPPVPPHLVEPFDLPPAFEPAAVPHGWDVGDYLTIIYCHTRLLLRATPEDDPRRVGLLAIIDAAQHAAGAGQLRAAVHDVDHLGAGEP